MKAPSFTIGIEEEYLLVDLKTRQLVPEPPEGLLSACEARAPKRVHPEFLRCQIEVGTDVCNSVAEARVDLAGLRHAIIEEAAAHGLAPIAASTHPFAVWSQLKHTDKERYNKLAYEMGAAIHRLMVSGMHVHCAIEDDDLRIDLMNQSRYFLPHLLALSTSSPFWQGVDTGRKSYRLSVWKELPRTGMPEDFLSYGEYLYHLDTLVRAGIIEDGTKLWWDIRPSARFPTLEMRISDLCTRMEDAITVAALYRCTLRMLWRLKLRNCSWRRYKNVFIEENRWRAQRYGIDSGLVDFGKGEVVPYADLLEEWLELLHEDAEALGCLEEILKARDILKRGTSAHRQVAIFREAKAAGATDREALERVVDWLIQETALGVREAAAG